jgi:hypothetical protein
MLRDSFLCEPERHAVVRERARRVAKQLAGELIEDDHLGEATRG